MKKKTILSILVGIVVIWSCFFATDYYLAKASKAPIFSIPIIRYKDGGSTEYFGLGYKVIKYAALTAEEGAKIEKVIVGTWFMNF